MSARLPVPGDDADEWGDILNEYLSVSHDSEGAISPNTNVATVFNVKDFGAVGNAIADDTAAIQAAIDAAVGGTVAGGASVARKAKGSVYLPPGNYRITSPLQVYSVSGFEMAGDSSDVVSISAASSIEQMLDLHGLHRSRIANLHLTAVGGYDGGVEVQDVLKVYWNGAGGSAARSTTGVIIDNVRIQNVKFVNGFRLGNNNNFQTDNITCRNCLVIGKIVVGATDWYQNGYYCDAASGNTLNHWLFNCGATFVRYGIHSKTVNVHAYAFDLGHNAVDVRAGATHPVNLDGFRSEASGRLLEVPSGTTNPCQVALRNGKVAYQDNPSAGGGIYPFASDSRFVIAGRSGSVLLENIVVQSGGIAEDPKIYIHQSSADKYMGITLIGCNISTEVEDLFEMSTSNPNSPASVTLINHTIGANNTLAVDFVSYYNKNFGINPKQPQFYAGLSDIERLGVAKTAGGEFVRDRRYWQHSSMTFNSGLLGMTYFRATRTESIGSLAVWTTNTAAGATPTLVRYGVYEVDESDGSLTLVASTANDTSLLAAANTKYTKALSSNWSKVAGRLYAVGVLVVTSETTPTIVSVISNSTSSGYGTALGIEPKVTGQVSGQTDLPSSISSTGGTLRAPFVEMIAA